MEETPGKMYALAAVLTTLAIVAVLLRFYARHIKKVHLAWDDYMILPALLFTIGTGLCMFTGTYHISMLSADRFLNVVVQGLLSETWDGIRQ